MAEATESDEKTAVADESSPGHSFLMTFQKSHDLYEKLVLLDYHREFTSQFQCKPIHR